jgi:hypothetical protein
MALGIPTHKQRPVYSSITLLYLFDFNKYYIHQNTFFFVYCKVEPFLVRLYPSLHDKILEVYKVVIGSMKKGNLLHSFDTTYILPNRTGKPISSPIVHNQWFGLISIKIVVSLIHSIHDIQSGDGFDGHLGKL